MMKAFYEVVKGVLYNPYPKVICSWLCFICYYGPVLLETF
jgi:hypothetical protein